LCSEGWPGSPVGDRVIARGEKDIDPMNIDSRGISAARSFTHRDVALATGGDLGGQRKGHALRASLLPVGEDLHSLNPFITRRFGSSGNALARMAPLCQVGCSSSDAVTNTACEKTHISTRSVTHACRSAKRVHSIFRPPPTADALRGSRSLQSHLWQPLGPPPTERRVVFRIRNSQ
jgi:hypothetical protein